MTVINQHDMTYLNFFLKDEKPSLKKILLIRMGLLYFGIELLFSIEVAMTVPILLKLNVPEE